jgi:hypothetical protein
MLLLLQLASVLQYLETKTVEGIEGIEDDSQLNQIRMPHRQVTDHRLTAHTSKTQKLTDYKLTGHR